MEEYKGITIKGKELNYYEFLGLDINVKEGKEITKAYRAKSLIYHPDKNQEDPDAEQLFVSLKKAYDTLKDENKKKEYDNYLKNTLEKKERVRRMDTTRKRNKDDLERREREAKEQRIYKQQQQKKQESDIDRLRKNFAAGVNNNPSEAPYQTYEKEVLPEIKTEVELISLKLKVLEKEIKASDTSIKIKWSKEENINEEELYELFNSFGTVEHIIGNYKKKVPNALISFTNVMGPHAIMQNKLRNDKRLEKFTVSWVNSENKEPERVTQIIKLMEELEIAMSKENNSNKNNKKRKRSEIPKQLFKVN
ncbi:DnaJ-domain-containing protein [Neoconidiobolus thromboides FSU 785]|nr:DnaJ-domain-containing protein [Neoconidiobolus thromboides FSU 785]